MSQAVEEKPGDVWITVDTVGVVPAKYYSTIATAVFPHGLNGAAKLEVRFNLTAYMRDMIAEAMGKT